jgi:hypothetical protein
MIGGSFVEDDEEKRMRATNRLHSEIDPKDNWEASQKDTHEESGAEFPVADRSVTDYPAQSRRSRER